MGNREVGTNKNHRDKKKRRERKRGSEDSDKKARERAGSRKERANRNTQFTESGGEKWKDSRTQCSTWRYGQKQGKKQKETGTAPQHVKRKGPNADSKTSRVGL